MLLAWSAGLAVEIVRQLSQDAERKLERLADRVRRSVLEGPPSSSVMIGFSRSHSPTKKMTSYDGK